MNIKGKKTKIIRISVLVIACFVFIFSAYQLIHIFLEYKQGTDEYDTISEAFIEPSAQPDEEVETQEVWSWDYAKMLEINSDAKGWIKQGEIISYPILQTDNNEYYLTHLATRKYNKAGSIFIDYRITEGLEAKNCILYGHNMKNKSMFGSLKGYYKESYYQEHKTFELYIAEKQYVYEVFAAYETPETSEAYNFSFYNDEEYMDYLTQARNNSIYKTDVRELNSEDKIITLSTCTDNDETKRFIVQLVRIEETINQ